MALLEIKRAEAERDLKKYCANRVPARIADKLRYAYRFRGNDVTLFEERPPWDGVGEKWSQMPVARFRYEPEENKWSVSWQRANGRWLFCDWIGKKARFCEALDEVTKDRHCTFFG
ncbi:MAG: hypothetical protein DRQ40_08550 [Gammaproteobacteria bacterium]|nr:MAG: hypothetical protein DRQ40_08550 [Gammaproteobacteria bacterium]